MKNKWRGGKKSGKRSGGRFRRIRYGMIALLFAALFGVLQGETAFALNRPAVSAEGAVLYRADTGTYLFEKNADVGYYPASVTKLMTALLVLENCNLDDTVTFTAAATEHLESGAVNLALTAGDRVSVRDCLYGLLLKSANEVANGLAEHVSGSVPAFAARMNARALELGCTGTNFSNPNGLTNAKHVTTAHDLALIAKACFSREDFRTIQRSTVYHFPATKKRPNGTTIVMGHKMLSSGSSLYYPGVLGGKTGYTRAAGNTLVTCAERNGVRLIAVVLKSRSTQYADTKALLDYGFQLSGTGQTEAEAAKATTQNEGAESGGPRSAEDKNRDTQAVRENSPGGEDAGSGSLLFVTPSHALSGEAESPEKEGETAASDRRDNGGEAQQGAQPASQTGPGAVPPGWKQQGGDWYYGKQDGMQARDERLEIDGFEYWFDEKGRMITGWKQDATGAWYYLRPSFGGMRKNGWIQDRGSWYYLSESGRMLTNAMTPDGYRVDAEGKWIEN